MKFGRKIFILCLAVYILSLSVTSIVVTENTYRNLLNEEIERSLEEEGNLHSTLQLYLMSTQPLQERIALKDYSKNLVDLVSTDRNYLEIYDETLELLASNAPRAWFYEREELKVALEGHKNFIIRREDGRLYLFVSNLLEIGQEKIVLAMIREITHVEKHRWDQYLFFLKTGLVGLAVVALVTWQSSIFLLRPFQELTATAQSIASGNYHVRTKVKRKDEVGLLAEQFNLMAEEVERKIKQLEEQGQRQQLFIDNLTHELRTPLTSIIGYADFLLKAKYDPAVFHKSLLYIHAEGKRILNLAKKMMDLIFIRENPLQLKEEDVLAILVEVQHIMQVKGEEKGITIEVTGSPAQVPVDKELFKTALINLVDNAIKASSPGQKVILGVKQDNRGTEVFVADQGRGMDEEHVSKVTEPFYRVDQSRSRKEGGIGLGLALVKQIVEKHNAGFAITSKTGVGTTIQIKFGK